MSPSLWIQRLTGLLLVMTLLGCQAPVAPLQPGGDARPSAAKSDLARLPPAASGEDVAALAAANTAFAFDLYQQIRTESGNLFYSPYSISLALAMTEAGAKGDTQSEMREALRFGLPEDSLHPAFNTLDQQLSERAASVVSPEEKPFELHIANALWGQRDYPIRQEYLDLLASNYAAGMRLVDFSKAPEAARLAVNRWVEEQTNDKIKDLVPEGAINELTRLVLANAIYFNAAWLNPFEKDNTRPADFHLLSGETASVQMMRQMDNFGYARGSGYQVVELPYVSHSFVMDVILPDEGQFEAVEAALTGEAVTNMLAGVQYTEVTLGLPTFEFEAQFGLSEQLKDLGMTRAFDPDLADFSGITEAEQLYIQDVLHKAYIRVDEAGTEAAAATAIMVGATSAPVEQVEVTVDRPFLFLIRERTSGTILFAGRVLQP